MAGELGIRDKLILPESFVKDVRPWLWATDIFVMPSREEGFSIALLEGLASGLPAIVSDIAPFTEIIGPNNGMVCEKDNPQSLASAMCRMLELGENGRAQIAANSLRMVQENFTYEAAAAKTLKVYSSAV